MKIHIGKYVYSPSLLALAIFLAFSIFFTFFSGPIGHAGDVWNFIYTSLYTDDIAHPVYLEEYWLLHRPIQYVLQVYLLLKLPGIEFNPIAIHFCTFLFLSCSIFLFGRILEKCYPNEPQFIFSTLLLLFFYEPLFACTFIVHHSTFFFAAITFWGTCLLILKMSYPIPFLRKILFFAGALGCFILSVFAVENFVLVIWCIPLIVYWGTNWSPLTETYHKLIHLILRAILPVGIIFGSVLGIKYVIIQYVGRQTNLSLSYFLEWLCKYWILALMYEFDAVNAVLRSNVRYLALILLAVLLFLDYRWTQTAKIQTSRINQYSPFFIGCSIFLCGITPLILGGYQVDMLNPEGPTGRYVASSFGVILMFSGTLLLQKNRIFYRIYQILLLFLISCNIANAFNLIDVWKGATHLQKSLYTSLLEICPNVKDDANFVFIDAQPKFAGKASILAGPKTTNILLHIIYDNQNLHGALAYSGQIDHSEQTMIITSEWIKLRENFLFPSNQVLVVKNIGERFELVDLQRTDILNAIWAESYYELQEKTMRELRQAGIPEGILSRLKSLGDDGFFKDDFIEQLRNQFDHEELKRYQPLILERSWNWTEEIFMLTEQDMQHIKDEGMPEGTLLLLACIENREFPTVNAFLNGVDECIGVASQKQNQKLLLKYARKKANRLTEVKSNRQLIKPQRAENAFTKYLSSLPD